MRRIKNITNMLPNCPSCGNGAINMTECPRCGSMKCESCDMGDDVECPACENMLGEDESEDDE